MIAVVELSAAAQPLARAAAFEGAVPTVAVACCAPDYVAGVLWGALQRFFPVHGYRERWGATAWETLRANRLDRVSVLEDLAGQGVVIAPAVIERAARIVGMGFASAPIWRGHRFRRAADRDLRRRCRWRPRMNRQAAGQR